MYYVNGRNGGVIYNEGVKSISIIYINISRINIILQGIYKYICYVYYNNIGNLNRINCFIRDKYFSGINIK